MDNHISSKIASETASFNGDPSVPGNMFILYKIKTVMKYVSPF